MLQGAQVVDWQADAMCSLLCLSDGRGPWGGEPEEQRTQEAVIAQQVLAHRHQKLLFGTGAVQAVQKLA